MSEPREWLTWSQATLSTGRSRRTLRRWIADPTNGIRTRRLMDETTINHADLLRVEADKERYRTNPTFGRK